MTYRRVEILKVCLSVILDRLVHGDPASLDELAEISGVHKDIVRKHLKVLINRELVYVADWRRHGRNQHWIPLFLFTTEKDKSVPKPKNLTEKQRVARSSERRRAKKLLSLTNVVSIKESNHNEIRHASISAG